MHCILGSHTLAPGESNPDFASVGSVSVKSGSVQRSLAHPTYNRLCIGDSEAMKCIDILIAASSNALEGDLTGDIK